MIEQKQVFEDSLKADLSSFETLRNIQQELINNQLTPSVFIVNKAGAAKIKEEILKMNPSFSETSVFPFNGCTLFSCPLCIRLSQEEEVICLLEGGEEICF